MDAQLALGLVQCLVVVGLPLFCLLCGMDVVDRRNEARRILRR